MAKFTEIVKQYSEEKKARGFSGIVNAREIARIRKMFNEGVFDKYSPDRSDSSSRDNREALSKLCRIKQMSKEIDGDSLSESKQRLRRLEGMSRIAKSDRLPESRRNVGERLTPSQRRKYEKTLAEFRDFKESKGLGRGVSTKQKRIIERTILAGTLTSPVEIRSTHDEPTRVTGPRVTENRLKAKIAKKIYEAKKNVYIAKIKLSENDMMAAADATQEAGDAVNAVNDLAAQGSVPQNIVDTVASLQQTVNDLATQCGIQPPVDVGADPNAGVPAVDGSMQTDMGTGMQEGKLRTTRERLAKRAALLKAFKEGNYDGLDAMTQEIEALTNPRQFDDIDKSNSEELVVPTTKKSSTAGNTWPTVKPTVKESITEKMISDRIAENNDRWDFSRILKEGILG